MSPIFHFGKLFVGKTFDIREGSRFVGRGTITQLFDERLQYWDYDTFFSLPHTLPTHQSEITELIAEIQRILLSIDNQATIKCIQNLTKKEQMLTVECNLSVSKNYAVVDALFPLWQNIFPYPRNLLKVNVSNNHAKCELEFALDGRHCLTGVYFDSKKRSNGVANGAAP